MVKKRKVCPVCGDTFIFRARAKSELREAILKMSAHLWESRVYTAHVEHCTAKKLVFGPEWKTLTVKNLLIFWERGDKWP